MFMKNEIILLVLEDVKKQLFDLSKGFINLDASSPYFVDSCEVIDARYKIERLYDALKLAFDYEH